MGDRGVVVLKTKYDEAPVVLYTHWGATELPQTVAAALLRGKPRWGDSNYLNRIIFCEMVGEGDVLGETGFGISAGLKSIPGDAWRQIFIDHDELTVIVDGDQRVHSFQEFIDRYVE